ncbi:3D domain-containing protein [Bacillus paramobilis]|uniref:3D domain-containing protein n=1 Tax=Bacillus paramobilis TaxID=2817477 RepID=UPI0022AA7655
MLKTIVIVTGLLGGVQVEDPATTNKQPNDIPNMFEQNRQTLEVESGITVKEEDGVIKVTKDPVPPQVVEKVVEKEVVKYVDKPVYIEVPAKEKPQEQPKQEVKPVTPEPAAKPVQKEETSGNSITVKATAYTNDPAENGTYGGKVLTRSGADITNSILVNGLPVIAVDPSVVPLNSKVRVEVPEMGIDQTYIAADTGGAIKGNRIDVLVSGSEAADQFGVRQAKVTILGG